MKKDIADDAFEEFFSLVNKRKQQASKRNEQNNRIIAEKNEILIPIRKLMVRLMEAGLYVEHQNLYDNYLTTRTLAPQEFKVWENESSPMYAPGSSIFFDHPAAVEIAIPNIKDREQHGLIKILCATVHPTANILHGPFYSAEEACSALVKFLSTCTLRIEREDE